MTPRSTFLRAIIARPDDDRPRLIYADALELGDAGFPAEPARGEFIRVQCELAKVSDPAVCGKCGNKLVRQHMSSLPDVTRCSTCSLSYGPFWKETQQKIKAYDALRRRERELLDANALEWHWWPGPMPLALAIELDPRRRPKPITFRRGFVEEITCTWADFIACAGRLLQVTPLRKVNLTGPPEVYMSGHEEDLRRWLKAHWPAIEFTWPTASQVDWNAPLNVPADLEEARQRIMDSL